MTRDAGFPSANIDSAYFSDDKVKALWRACGDQTLTAVAVVIHIATILGSWQAGRRLTAEEAAPVLMVLPDEALKALVTARLLDRFHRIPQQTWDEWFEPAQSRREQARRAGAAGNRARWGGDAIAGGVAPRSRGESRRDPQPTDLQTYLPTDLPTLPTRKGTSNARPRASRGAARGPTSLADAVKGTPFAAAHGIDE